jgi:hypothetical protein
MRGGLFQLNSFSYSSPDSMSGINQIAFLDSDHFVVRLGGLQSLRACGVLQRQTEVNSQDAADFKVI